MREGCHWIVVTDPQVRAQVGDFYRRSAEPYLASAADPDRGAGVGGEVMARVSSSSVYLARHVGPGAGIGDPAHYVRPAWSAGETQAALGDRCCPAAWSYMLACRARGLGSAWTTLHLKCKTEIGALLGLSEGIHQGVPFPTAYYTGDTFRPAARRPRGDGLHVDSW